MREPYERTMMRRDSERREWAWNEGQEERTQSEDTVEQRRESTRLVAHERRDHMTVDTMRTETEVRQSEAHYDRRDGHETVETMCRLE